jgi:sulfide dehydrogenase cytochrome subunit
MFFSRAPLKQSNARLASVLLVMSLSITPFATVCAQTTFDVSLLAGNCLNCHVSDVKSATSIPVIAGKPEAVLKAQLLAYKSDKAPPGTTIMNRLAKGYSDDEIAALAVYFSTLDDKGVVSAGVKK